MSSLKQLTKEQQEQVVDVLVTFTKRERCILQAMYVANFVFQVVLGVVLVYKEWVSPAGVIVLAGLEAYGTFLDFWNRRSIFSEFRQGFVEPEPDHEFIKQCKKRHMLLTFSFNSSIFAAGKVVICSVAFWYTKLRLFGPILASTLAVVGVALVGKKAFRETAEIKWQVWEFISRDAKC